jgi:hypothetical protein
MAMLGWLDIRRAERHTRDVSRKKLATVMPGGHAVGKKAAETLRTINAKW